MSIERDMEAVEGAASEAEQTGVDTITSVESEGNTGKKVTKKKIILAAIGTVLACILILVAAVLISSSIQMKFMTNYVMKNLRNYNWTALQMEDPVKSGLVEAFGQDSPESVDILYNYMKDAASQMDWEIEKINTQDMTTTVKVKYTDRSQFLDEYAIRMSKYIMDRLDAGTMNLGDMMNVMDMIKDDENKKLLNDSMERVYELTLGTQDRGTASVTVNFERKGLLCMPTGTSDEVNDVASAGLFKNLDQVTDKVAVSLIPQVIDRVFLEIHEFDEDGIKRYTGKSIHEYLNMEEDNKIYKVLVDYLRVCAVKMTYSIGELDPQTGEITVECKHLDSNNVIKQFVKLLTKYSMENLFLQNPKKIDTAAVLREATDTATDELVDKTVVITFENNYRDFKISDEIYDVVSANLYSEVGELVKYLK